MQLEHVKDFDTNLAWVAKFHMNFIMKLLRHYICTGTKVYEYVTCVVSQMHVKKRRNKIFKTMI